MELFLQYTQLLQKHKDWTELDVSWCLFFLIIVDSHYIYDCRIGCVVLYTGQGKFHGSTTSTLGYVVDQAETTSENLKNVSEYLSAAKRIGIGSTFLPANVQTNIDHAETKINASATTLDTKTQKNSKDIQDLLDAV